MKRVLAVLVAVALTLATVKLILSTVSIDTLVTSFRAARWGFLLPAFALFATVQWIRAWRFSLITSGTAALPDLRFVSVAFRLNFLNFVVPFRLGEFGYPIMMHREFGQKPAEALGVLVLARIFDLSVVGAILIGLGAWFEIFGDRIPAALPFIVSLVLLLFPSSLILFGSSGFRLPVPAGRISRIGKELSQSIRTIKSLHMQFWTMLLTLAIWITFGLAAGLAARSVTMDVAPLAAMFGAAAGNLAFALPATGIAGLGASQAAWVLAVRWAGVAMEPAVISALVNYFVTLASALTFGILAFARQWIGRPSRKPSDI